MKKEDKCVIPYNKKKIVKIALKLFESPKKIIIIDYNGKRLNSIYGIKEDLKQIKIPLKYTILYIIKRYFQIPIFRIIKNIGGGEFKNRIYRHFGVKMGKDVYISSGVYIDETFPELISIGEGSIIGKDVSIFTHEFTIKHARFGKVSIGKQVTVGINSIIRSGIIIGDKSIIAMDSLVNKDIPSKEEWGGIPAHKIKNLKKLL